MHMALNWCFTRVLIDAVRFNRCFIISSFNLATLQQFFKNTEIVGAITLNTFMRFGIANSLISVIFPWYFCVISQSRFSDQIRPNPLIACLNSAMFSRFYRHDNDLAQQPLHSCTILGCHFFGNYFFLFIPFDLCSKTDQDFKIVLHVYKKYNALLWKITQFNDECLQLV